MTDLNIGILSTEMKYYSLIKLLILEVETHITYLDEISQSRVTTYEYILTKKK